MNDTKRSGSSGQELVFQVTAEEAGLRLDAFLTARLPDLSRNRIQTDLQEGRILVDGRRRPKSFRLKEAGEVRYLPGEAAPLEAVPQDIPLDIVYRDDDLLVVNKPAGLVVHPSAGHPDGTLVNALLHHCGQLGSAGDPLRPGIVHRLDRDTSGLLAVALNDRALRRLADQLRDRRMGRTYLALSWGQWDPDAGTLTGDIGRHPRQRQKMAIVRQGGRPAVTHYQVEADYGFVQLCRIRLETGRTHQIRVHFAANHHPIMGDPVYGSDNRVKSVHALDRHLAQRVVQLAGRQLLHAARLQLEHPVTGQALDFSVPVPADMASVLHVLEQAT